LSGASSGSQRRGKVSGAYALAAMAAPDPSFQTFPPD
jgi:hypothetical protein